MTVKKKKKDKNRYKIFMTEGCGPGILIRIRSRKNHGFVLSGWIRIQIRSISDRIRGSIGAQRNNGRMDGVWAG